VVNDMYLVADLQFNINMTYHCIVWVCGIKHINLLQSGVGTFVQSKVIVCIK